MNELRSSRLRAYAVALLATGAALLLTFVLQPHLAQNLLLLFAAAVVISTWYGGLVPGLLASVLSVVATAYFFLEPKDSLPIASANEILQLIVFVFVAATMSLLMDARKQAQKQLSDSNEQLATILRGINDGIVVQDAAGQLVYANTAAALIVGYPSAEALIGTPLNEALQKLELQNESGDPLPLPQYPSQRALQGETVRETLLRFARHPLEGARWLAISATPIRDQQHHVQFVINIFHDVTAQKRAEQRLNAQYSLARILADTDTLAAAAPRLLQTICESFDWESGLLWVVDREADVLRCAEHWRVQPHASHHDGQTFEADSRQRAFGRGVGLPGRIWVGGEPAWVADVTQDSNFARAPIAATERLHAVLGFPIKLGSEVLGVMEFFSHQTRQPDGDLLALMTTIGSQVGQFINRERAQDALRQAEVKYRALVEQIPAITYMSTLGESGGFTYISPQHEAILGFTQAEWINNAELRRSRIHPHDRERVLAEHQHTLASGKPFRCEYRLFARDGRELWMHDEAVIVRDEQGQPRFMQGVVFDVTERKQAEQELRELADARDRALAETKLLNDIAIAAAGEQNLGRILTTALLQLREIIRFTGGSVALVADGELVIRAAFGPFSEIALGNRSRHGVGQSWQVIKTSEPLLVNDVVVAETAKPTTPFRAWLGVPLTWRGQTFGLLEIDSTEAAAFSAADMLLMQKVATVLSGPIELSQRYAVEVRALVEAEAAQWRLETVLRQMPSGVIIAEAPSGKIILGNEQMATIWRHPLLPSDEINQYVQYRSFHPDGRAYEPHEWPLARSITTGEIVTGEEIDFIRGDETRGTMNVNAAPIRNRRGDIIAGVVVFDDITERKRYETALHGSNSILKAVYEGTSDAVFVKDLQGRYLLMNTAGARMLNRTPSEIIGKSDVELFSAESVRRITAHDQQVITTGEALTYEEVATAAGITRTYLSTKGPYRNPEGKMIGLVGISRDITERKRSEDNQRFLAEASRVLGSSLDYETTLGNVAQLAVRQLADWCSVHILNEDNPVPHLASHRTTPWRRRSLRTRTQPKPNRCVSC